MSDLIYRGFTISKAPREAGQLDESYVWHDPKTGGFSSSTFDTEEAAMDSIDRYKRSQMEGRR